MLTSPAVQSHSFLQFAPTREGYLRFLVESKAVYDVLEAAVQSTAHPEYAAFCNTGLERAKALEEDIAWFRETHNLTSAGPEPGGPGATYGAKIAELAEKDAPVSRQQGYITRSGTVLSCDWGVMHRTAWNAQAPWGPSRQGVRGPDAQAGNTLVR